MKSAYRNRAMIALSLISSMALAQQPDAAQDHDPCELMRLGLRGVYFVPNQGQWPDPDVHLGLRSRGLEVAFRQSSLTMHLMREARESNGAIEASPKRARERGVLAFDDPDPLSDGRGLALSSPAKGALFGESADFEHPSITIMFPGSNDVQPDGASPQRAKFNYFVGGEGRTIASDVPSFGEVVYPNLYDGVDLHVTSAACGDSDGILKYEFHVAPGADFSQIRIAYDGIDSLCIDNSGDLCVEIGSARLVDAAPIAWQPALSLHETATIGAHFELCDERTYRIVLDDPVDSSRRLIIDPELAWMNYYGGTLEDHANGVAVDASGHILLSGYTASTDFEGHGNQYNGGDYDAFVLKLDPAGNLEWMTYLGGTKWERAVGIAVDSAGNALAGGWTRSSDFGGRNNSSFAYEDAFVLKISPTGMLQWMTYLGGNVTDWGYGVAVDSADNAVVVGKTDSTDFIGRNNSNHGRFDAFAAKVSPSGALLWSTYLGGSNGESSNTIAVDSNDEFVLTGVTGSSSWAGQLNGYPGGSASAFAVKLSATGQTLWMRYLGGTEYEEGIGVAIEGDGHVVVVGMTTSLDFDGRNNELAGGVGDGYAVRLTPEGALAWMTYLGGARYDLARSVCIDGHGRILVTGGSDSREFPARLNANHGLTDAYVLEVSQQGQLQWMTYLGGSHLDNGYGIAAFGEDQAIVAGDSFSIDFDGAANSQNHGGADSFAVRLTITEVAQLRVVSSCPAGGPIEVAWTGATGGAQVAVLYARNPGDIRIPDGNPCAGTLLGLGANQLQIVFRGSAGPEGSRTLNARAGSSACGGYLQLVDFATCTTSIVAEIQ